MFVIFGWLKEKLPVKPVLNCYCYGCQRTSSWEIWRETEWVTFFYMRTIPFLSKDALACPGCKDSIPVQKRQSAALLRGEQETAFVKQLEEHQLSGKSEVQRNFLLSMRSSRESATDAA
jgi:hypothetical protein